MRPRSAIGRPGGVPLRNLGVSSLLYTYYLLPYFFFRLLLRRRRRRRRRRRLWVLLLLLRVTRVQTMLSYYHYLYIGIQENWRRTVENNAWGILWTSGMSEMHFYCWWKDTSWYFKVSDIGTTNFRHFCGWSLNGLWRCKWSWDDVEKFKVLNVVKSSVLSLNYLLE